MTFFSGLDETERKTRLAAIKQFVENTLVATMPRDIVDIHGCPRTYSYRAVTIADLQNTSDESHTVGNDLGTRSAQMKRASLSIYLDVDDPRQFSAMTTRLCHQAWQMVKAECKRTCPEPDVDSWQLYVDREIYVAFNDPTNELSARMLVHYAWLPGSDKVTPCVAAPAAPPPT
jgi:hypothetical protein